MSVKAKELIVPDAGNTDALAYPPSPLTNNLTRVVNAVYGNGSYIASSSSVGTNGVAWKAFDALDTGGYWQPTASTYSTTTPFAYTGTVGTVNAQTGTRYAGEWLQLELPVPLILTAFHLTPFTTVEYVPGTFSVFGSKNKIEWDLLQRVTGFSATTRTLFERPLPIADEGGYTTFRLVVENAAGNGAAPAIMEWVLYGKNAMRTFVETDESYDASAVGCITTGKKEITTIDGPLSLVDPMSTMSIAGPTVFKNRILNGDMFIDSRYGYTLGTMGWGFNNANTRQRGSATITGATYPAYLCDRWQIDTNRTNLSLTYNQIDIPAAAAPCADGLYQALQLSWTSAFSVTGANYFWLGQVIESNYLYDLGWKGKGQGSPITISFWLRTTFTGQTSVVVRNDNAQASYIKPITIINTDWNKYSFTVPPCPFNTGMMDAWVSSGVGVGMIVQFLPLVPAVKTAAGSTGGWTSPPMQSVTGATNYSTLSSATIQLTGVQLEKGYMASPFEHRYFSIEDAMCRRYFEKDRFVYGYYWANITDYGIPASIPFISEKRILPQVNPNAGYGNIDVSKYTGMEINPKGLIVRQSGVSLRYAYFIDYFRWEADADFKERRYPPMPLTDTAGASITFTNGQDVGNESYGNGRYYVMHSSQQGGNGAYNMFTYDYTKYWSADPVHYDATTGIGLRASLSGTSYMGEYAIIRVPVAFSLIRFRLVNPNQQLNPYNTAPKAYRIYGSNNRSTWVLLHADEDVVQTSGTFAIEQTIASKPAAYQFYAIVVNKIDVEAMSFSIGQWELYGSDEASVTETPVVYPPIQLNSGWREYDFPEVGQTLTGQSYGNGEYKVSTTPLYNNNTPSGVFSKATADSFSSLSNAFTSREESALFAYSGSSPFSYLGTLNSGARVFDFVVNDYLGCWIKIKLPHEIRATSFGIGPRTNILTQCAGKFRLYGSNNASDWTTIHDQTTPLTFASNGTLTFVNISTTTYYMYYAFVVNTLAGSGQNMVITALRLNGVA
jgi:hypothetical protein